MPDKEKPAIGGIEWRDLTVDNAVDVKNFYAHVVGWETEAVSMGDYDDFSIKTPSIISDSGRVTDGETVAGICHSRGVNSKIPPQWLMYVRVANVSQSAERTVSLGGKIIDGPKAMGNEQFCVIQDPAGAYLGLVSS